MGAPTKPETVPVQTPWVVRHRIAVTWLPGVAYAIAIILYRGQAREDLFGMIVESIGLALIMAATAGRIWCAIYIAGRKNKELATEGPYSICRNPLYLFSFLGTIGLALGAKSLGLAAIVTPVFWIYYSLVIRSEERVLTGIFGERFENYRRSVPAVIPKWSLYRSGAELTIQPNKVSTGMIDALWFLWAVIALQWLEYAKGLWLR
jgi:protein-S-isoprenylcysteine O-methyltransferase Ste14